MQQVRSIIKSVEKDIWRVNLDLTKSPISEVIMAQISLSDSNSTFKICLAEGCNGRVKHLSYCESHYRRLHKRGLVGGKKPSRGKCSMIDCNKSHSARGYCDRHYARLMKYGDPFITHVNNSIGTEQIQVFWRSSALTANPDKCWEWQKSLSNRGYGDIRMLIGGKRWNLAHRIAYFLYYGVDPKELFVCHHCDNRKCVNPLHLFLGTNTDNVRDMYKKGRSSARLDVEQVREIKARLHAGETQLSIARSYNVSKSTVGKISSGVHWRTVQYVS